MVKTTNETKLRKYFSQSMSFYSYSGVGKFQQGTFDKTYRISDGYPNILHTKEGSFLHHIVLKYTHKLPGGIRLRLPHLSAAYTIHIQQAITNQKC